MKNQVEETFQVTYWYVKGYSLGERHRMEFGKKSNITPPCHANECYMQGYNDSFEN